MTAPILIWLRRDLRLADHPALAAAAAEGPVVLAFCLDEQGGRPFGGASRWWLHQSLAQLGGVTLALGRSEQEIPRLALACGARAVYWNQSADPVLRTVEDRVQAALTVPCRIFPGDTLFAPGSVRSKSGGQFQVFTAFWRAALALPPPARPLPAPAALHVAPCPGLELNALGLMPKLEWWRSMASAWRPGEAGATTLLGAFLDGPVQAYHRQRDRPDHDATSRLSPHLAFGEISPRQIWHAAQAVPPDDGVRTFLKELGWREFSRHLLANHPTLPQVPLRREFAAFPWRDDPAALRQWQMGRTGYPIVDAGMRQLWATGWMHNRVRMVVASFLIKDLLIPWQAGEEWFWDTLVDADSASNAASWQWVAGSGADAAPFFRIFNPVTQGEKFDPDGSYVRNWVPELAHLSTAVIHQPWKLGRVPGYPPPMIDHAAARTRALAAFKGLRGAPEQPRFL
ncbi:cryptochrome/photolyase family protein [Magnetospirillum sulfuroxidans]|uniref:Deoxyribodipyrimidine photo-lyase n=1 Tax=Magnetospirillum sulfuroxidans TaxID=611300 RepID=A0ABS5I732_9PROT|nr:deoxyribodipyrimidine photo-lyase [Magnetospirillum sulfuroxidans]MBR9970129.1 deoxyribodipyrimidine photo-lyase [Magnetospirillum sulfuroxidans]